jgi:hypothetical protein
MTSQLSGTGRALACAATVLALAGFVVLLATDGTAGNTAATILLGVAGVLVVSLAFLLVGESEDRERKSGR